MICRFTDYLRLRLDLSSFSPPTAGLFLEMNTVGDVK